MRDTAEFDVRSRTARSRTIPIAVIAICLFIVGMIGSAPMAANLARDLPLISRLMPPRGDDESAGPVTLPGAFTYQQQRPLSCEYASVHIATTMIGRSISEYEIEAVIPKSPNPGWGYRGDIMGTWGNTDDYGVYKSPWQWPGAIGGSGRSVLRNDEGRPDPGTRCGASGRGLARALGRWRNVP